MKDRIVIARQSKGWNQSDLARAMDVSATAVQEWEKGNGPHRKRWDALCNALDVDPPWFQLGIGEGPKIPSSTLFKLAPEKIDELLDLKRIKKSSELRKDPVYSDLVQYAIKIGKADGYIDRDKLIKRIESLAKRKGSKVA